MDVKTRYEQTAQGWDTASDAYDRVIAPFTEMFAQDVLRACPPAPGGRVLELAAGTGSLTRRLLHGARHVLVTDFSPRMLATLRATIPPDPRMEIALMDAHELALPDASVDRVYCMFGAMHFHEPARAFAEAVRVLRPGGHIAVATWNDRSQCFAPLADAVNAVLAGSSFATAFDSVRAFGDITSCTRALLDAGFVAIESHEAVHELTMTQYTYLYDLGDSDPLAIALHRMLPSGVLSELRSALQRTLHKRFGTSLVRLKGIANIAVAARA